MASITIVSAASDYQPVRLTRRGRLVLTLLGSLVAATVASVAISAVTASDAVASDVATAEYTVKPGDSLWSIAREIAPGADPRDLVVELTRLNPASEAGVFAGQVLIVPAP
ncbi:MAG: LysM peptidoglycan-binding domain-containing protein [Actinobacteria bacterium]|nr:LysM peptidoglycan-binding domain-containing protein [Actinomycetota bacterium]